LLPHKQDHSGQCDQADRYWYLAYRVIDPNQFGNHFCLHAVYGDDTSYPGMIYPWIGTLCLLNGLIIPDVLRHAGFNGAMPCAI
jgi:hypothetical protein